MRPPLSPRRAHPLTKRARGAGTALALYDKYVELKAQGAVDAAIQQLYDIGRETRWEVPD